MNFDFPDELKQLRDEARRFLTERCPTSVPRRILEGPEPYDRALWQAMAEMGWTGAAIPEEYGGAGLGHLAVCVLAEELGHAVAPVPFSSSVYLATEAIQLFGSDAQKRQYLPKLAAGEMIGTFAMAERPGPADPAQAGRACRRREAERHQTRGAGRRCGRLRRGRGARGPGAVPRHRRSHRPRRGARDRHHDRSHAIACADRVRRCAGRTAARQRGRRFGASSARPGSGDAGVRAGRLRPGGAGDGPRLCARAVRVRPADRLVPGDQAQARRHLHRGRAGALQRVLRRLGAAHGCRRTADRRVGRPHFGVRCRMARVQGEHPDAWRHGLHLADGLPVLLPPRQTACAGTRRHARMEAPADRRAAHAATRSRCRRTEGAT